MFKLVHYEAHTVGKLATGILLKCFFALFQFQSNMNVSQIAESLGNSCCCYTCLALVPIVNIVVRYGQRSKIRWRPLLFSKILAAQLPQDRNIVVILSMASQILFYLYFFCWTSNQNVQKWSLPPANEVWGKVMFLHLCVILFMGGAGSAHPPPIGRLGGGQTPSQEELPRQTTPQMQSPCPRQTPWMQSPPGRPPDADPSRQTPLDADPPRCWHTHSPPPLHQQAGSTHPTGMHSSLFVIHFENMQYYDTDVLWS